jgi:hypothetical protein
MLLDAGEFMRRFLMHVLPDGFHRIRHYGLFANGHRAEKLALCRKLLNVPVVARVEDDASGAEAKNDEPPPCPCCGGRMRLIAWMRSTSAITVAGIVTSASQSRGRSVGLAGERRRADDQRRCSAVRLDRSSLLVMNYRTS